MRRLPAAALLTRRRLCTLSTYTAAGAAAVLCAPTPAPLMQRARATMYDPPSSTAHLGPFKSTDILIPSDQHELSRCLAPDANCKSCWLRTRPPQVILSI